MTQHVKRYTARDVPEGIREAADGEYILYSDYIELLNRSKREAIVDSEDVIDAARYRWLRERAPDTLCGVAWIVKTACRFGTPDEAIDAARGARPGALTRSADS